MNEREQLEQQLKDLEAQKVALFDSGSADQAAVIRINEEIKGLRQQLSAIENEDIAESYQASDKPYIITVGGQEINLRDYMPKEEYYQFIAIALSQSDNEKEADRRAAERELTDLFEIERRQFRDQLTNADTAADAKYNELYEQSQQWKLDSLSLKVEREEKHEIKLERDDFERKWQAATNEIDSLKQQLELASAKVETPKPTNLDGNLAEAMRKANEAKRAIYNVQKDLLEVNYTAQYVDNDEEFSDKVAYIGKYRQMSNEEAQRFQQEAEQAKQTELESTPEAEVIPEPVEEQFRNDLPAPELSDVDATDGLDENVTEGQDGQNDGRGAVAETWEQWVESTLLNLVSTVNGLTTDSVLSSAKPPVREAA